MRRSCLAAGLLLIGPVLAACGSDPSPGLPCGCAGTREPTVWSLAGGVEPQPGQSEVPIVLHESDCAYPFSEEPDPPAVSYEATQVIVTVSIAYNGVLAPTCGHHRLVPYVLHLQEPLGTRTLVDGCTRRPLCGTS